MPPPERVASLVSARKKGEAAMVRMSNGAGKGISAAVNVEGVIEGQKVRRHVKTNPLSCAEKGHGFLPAKKNQSLLDTRKDTSVKKRD